MNKLLVWLVLGVVGVVNAYAAERQRIAVTSSLDGSEQPSYLALPDDYERQVTPRPLLVILHSWSADLEQRHPALEDGALARGWIVLCPNFRGANRHPQACGSALAQQDILDAVAWCRARLRIDADRIYLTGSSGGGHMTMLMVGRHPTMWAAASAWVGISDLAAWHRLHAGDNYGQNLRAVLGGAPEDGESIREAYRERSPLTHLTGAIKVPLDIAAGIHDGHTGSVPIHHSLDAFNVIARAAGTPEISPREIAELSRRDGRLSQPQPGDMGTDEVWGRAYYLRRQAGPVRVTIFEGGHEGIAAGALDWLARHRQTADK